MCAAHIRDAQVAWGWRHRGTAQRRGPVARYLAGDTRQCHGAGRWRVVRGLLGNWQFCRDGRVCLLASRYLHVAGSRQEDRIMNQLSDIETFWQRYLSTLSEEEQKNTLPYVVDQFADTPEAATKVGRLVCDGVKTTTSSLVWGLEHNSEPLPKVGDIELIVDGNGEPLCIIELSEVEIKPFYAVDEQFAFDYGEGDRTLAYWLHANWEFHSHWCRQIGREPSDTMPIVFQRFRVLYSQK